MTALRLQRRWILFRSDLRKMKHGLKFVSKQDWAWIHFKTAIGILCPTLAWINPPQAVSSGLVTGWVMNMILVMLLFGGLISITGLLLRGTRVRPLIVGYAFEMCGLIPLIAGPILLCFIYAVSAVLGATGPSSWVGFAFCYSLTAALFARYVDTLINHLAYKGDGMSGKGAV